MLINFRSCKTKPLSKNNLITKLRHLFEYLFNALCATVALAILSPFLLLAILVIKLKGQQQVFFTQTRVGLNSQTFTMYKLQTMLPEISKNNPFITTDYNDSRITPIGKVLRKYKIDELPQLVNIIKGEMNLVGPRPEIPYFHKLNASNIKNWEERICVKPGLTGLAQIHPTVSHDPQEKLEVDLEYIQKRSFLFDLKILYQTLYYLLTGKRYL